MVESLGPPENEKGPERIIVLGSTLSFGILGAIIASMRDFVGGDASFNFSYRTIVGFGLGALVAWLLWRVIRWQGQRPPKA
jgi:hypothetical protein